MDCPDRSHTIFKDMELHDNGTGKRFSKSPYSLQHPLPGYGRYRLHIVARRLTALVDRGYGTGTRTSLRGAGARFHCRVGGQVIARHLLVGNSVRKTDKIVSSSSWWRRFLHNFISFLYLSLWFLLR